MGRARKALVAATFAACGLAVCSCQREQRIFRPVAPFAEAVAYTDAFESNAYAQSEGKRLYSAFNCNGCHAHGGGDSGPALMDAEWIYGYAPKDVFESIAAGRPNGMPAFGGRVPQYQIWQLVAYVRSLSGLAPGDAASGRDDDINYGPPENSRRREDPVRAPAHGPAEVPQ